MIAMKFLFFISLILLVCFSEPILAQSSLGNVSIISNTNQGAWSNPDSWSNKSAPTNSDDIVLSKNIAVDLNAYCKSLLTNGRNIIVNSGTTLNVTGSENNESYTDNIIEIIGPTQRGNKINSIQNNEQMLNIYQVADLGFDFYFWGIKSNGIVSKVTSVSVRRHNTHDTVYNLILNDSMQVKKYFVSVNGINDSTVYKSLETERIYHLFNFSSRTRFFYLLLRFLMVRIDTLSQMNTWL